MCSRYKQLKSGFDITDFASGFGYLFIENVSTRFITGSIRYMNRTYKRLVGFNTMADISVYPCIIKGSVTVYVTKPCENMATGDFQQAIGIFDLFS